jgi:hypothetical protein
LIGAEREGAAGRLGCFWADSRRALGEEGVRLLIDG